MIDLSAKKFQIVDAKKEGDDIVIVLQFGNQVGAVSINANHMYRPQDLYRFVELLDDLIGKVAITMYDAEKVADLSVLNLFPGKDTTS